MCTPGERSCSCGLVNFFPSRWTWRGLTVSVGALLSLAAWCCMWPKEQGVGKAVKIFYCCSSTCAVIQSVTHTAGSASFHKSHKSEGPVKTFTLSSRAVNALPLFAAPDSQQKAPADSSLPSPIVSFGSGIRNMPASYCPFMVRLNAKHSWSGC